MSRSLCSLFIILLSGFFLPELTAQPAWTTDPFGNEPKPEQFKEKKLGSEKTAEKKYTIIRKVTQNTVTHYNYYFNANNKLNMVLENARQQQQEDYTKLLPFYGYSLDNTAAQQTELDSVIYKCTAGILLHDLRNDWVDNLYLLIGKAYYFRKEFDSAAMTFQFINYNLFPRKKGDDDNRVIGSNAGLEPGSMFSIADREKPNPVKKVFSKPPSRNDALIWLARSFTDGGMYGDAAGIINILQTDPNLPARLKSDLNEVNAYWFYRQQMYDSCAPYLERALDNADNKLDKARWEYLLAQLYEMNRNGAKASEFYLKAAKHTVDPMLDIYANLNEAKMATDMGDMSQLGANISRLLKMARKDKFNAYRDIIYLSAATLTMKEPDTAKATDLFLKSLKYNSGNMPVKNKAFLQLGDIAYDQRKYRDAASYYDSIDLSDPALLEDTAEIAARKLVLNRIAELVNQVEREDSLQSLAALSPAERDAAIKKLVRKGKKESGGKKGEDVDSGGNLPIPGRDEQPDLFATSSKGEWYFYNSNLRTKGFNEFRNKWGKRANLDNWRRKSSVDAALKNITANIDIDSPPSADTSSAGTTGLVPGTYDALMADIPLSQEQMDSSNARIAAALLELGRIFQNDLQDYPEAILAYEEYMRRFSREPGAPDACLGLFFSYNKLGMTTEAAKYKKMLMDGYAGTVYEKAVTNPSLLLPSKDDPQEAARYQNIYDLFIEGKFEEALAAKKSADSLFGNGYWTPQLLYLEAVYYVRERNDSAAIAVLDDIIQLYPQSPLAEKAATMKDVVSRRAEIEAYLSNLDVTRAVEEKVIVKDSKPVNVIKPAETRVQDIPTVKPLQPSVRPNIALDTVKTLPNMTSAGYVLQPDKNHFVMMVLDKVDAVYINEVKNAFSRMNRESSETRGLVINRDNIDPPRALLLIENFEDATSALSYIDRLKKNAPKFISWLPASKYSFYIITENNLRYLKETGNLDTYRNLLSGEYPGRF